MNRFVDYSNLLICTLEAHGTSDEDVPVTRTIQRWSDKSEATRQDCFDHADWNMFQSASENDIDLYTDLVSAFINKCIGDVVPTVTIKTYPN